MQVKGMELPLHDPRLKTGIGLGYMVSPIGADHCLNMHDTMFVMNGQMKDLHSLGLLEGIPGDEMSPRKAVLLKAVQGIKVLDDSLGICFFLPYNYRQRADLTAGVTGWDTDIPEQIRITERILTMMRLFNVREGFSEADDKLPARIFQPKTDGILSTTKLDPAKYERAKKYYYTLMGWDANTGIPLPEKTEELGISTL
jgi:aldehyde:ferredoxin oxidoreductase